MVASGFCGWAGVFFVWVVWLLRGRIRSLGAAMAISVWKVGVCGWWCENFGEYVGGRFQLNG